MIVDSQQYVNVFLGCLTVLGFFTGAVLYRQLPWDFWFCVFMGANYIGIYTYDWLMVDQYQVSPAFSWRQTYVRAFILAGIWLKHAIFLYHIKLKR